MRVQRWQDVASLLVGSWLIVSPWALGLTGPGAWFTAVLGLFVMLFAIEGLLVPSYLEELAEIGLALGLMVGPMLLEYGSITAVISAVASGALVMTFALWEIMTDREVIAWWHDHWHRGAA